MPEPKSLAAALAALMGVALMSSAATAQTVPNANDPGWRFSLTPYLWLPNLSGDLRYGPREQGTANVHVNSNNIIDALKFGLTFGAEARYGRFTLATDLLYLDLGNSSSEVRSVDFGRAGRVQATANLNTQSALTNTLWTLAPGYTLLEGAWGNVDIQAGFRLLAASARTNFQLATDVTSPRTGETFARIGRITGSQQIWDGIIGLRGRFDLGSGFYIPYAADVGTGTSNLTWQIQGGLGYSTGWAGVVAGYRYLSYSQGGNALIQELNMGGPFIALNMKF
ncbi:hypothetical protein KTR66_22900 [Roseococcus sp. SDR]|uniref:hypothetical protein n=1 Tax=Roseococcus sp. SDR TaxID=2835532 RepID=UPI001BCC8BEE|nr:hypothetical protein [Roseococcus sp. SDR]MBS7792856.1 hypothetical protein [Roseococcus sp. SDR]MBV1848170.1 hypothetical protein [Roseococcus sp. SDR]